MKIMNDLTHLSLFSGIGGLDLAAEWAGITTVGQCEWADYPTRVLEKHWPDVPRWRDIRTLTKESFYERTRLHTVDIISGGFPCQPFSVAGERRGKEDDRYLWPEMLRVIQEIKPTWVIGENVAGIVNMALDTVLSDLETIGYSCQAFVIPACAVDAPHRKDRVAILANSDTVGLQAEGAKQQATRVARSREDAADTNGKRLSFSGYESGFEQIQPENGVEFCGSWPTEPNVGRVAHGIPYRVDRIKCLGNAVVPQQFYPIFRAIADLEEHDD